MTIQNIPMQTIERAIKQHRGFENSFILFVFRSRSRSRSSSTSRSTGNHVGKINLVSTHGVRNANPRAADEWNDSHGLQVPSAAALHPLEQYPGLPSHDGLSQPFQSHLGPCCISWVGCSAIRASFLLSGIEDLCLCFFCLSQKLCGPCQAQSVT